MSNAFESGQQKVIPAVLLYAFYQNEVLMIHRNLKQNDFHEGKWNGLGGKLESGESPVAAAVREFKEEAECDTLTSQWKWLGQLYFPNFKPHKKEDWWVTVFAIDLNAEQVQRISVESALASEGTLHWVSLSKVVSLNLWDGDKEFIPYVLKRTPFEGTFFYENGACARFELKKISF
jgi:8-oxo-dGTP diphosphatase